MHTNEIEVIKMSWIMIRGADFPEIKKLQAVFS
jgi:hypothetical protein